MKVQLVTCLGLVLALAASAVEVKSDLSIVYPDKSVGADGCTECALRRTAGEIATDFEEATGWKLDLYDYEGKKCAVYQNGALVASVNISKATDNNDPLVFGNNINIVKQETGDACWQGWIDEVRYLKGAKSAAWVAAEYAAMADANFLSAGKVEGSGEEPEPPEEPAEIPVAPILSGEKPRFAASLRTTRTARCASSQADW